MLIRGATIVHLTSDLNGNHYVLPSKISIYPKNILRRAKNDDLNGQLSLQISKNIANENIIDDLNKSIIDLKTIN